MKERFFVLLLVIAILAQIGSSQDVPADSKKTADEQDIYATVIRNQMEQWVKEGDKNEAEAKDTRDKVIAHRLNYRIFFVEVEGKDPSDDFIKRFADIPRTIKKASEELPNKRPHQPKDKATHQSGIIFRAEHVKWLDRDSVQVEGGYYCGGLCADGETYKLRREDGKWVIKSAMMNWIS